MGTSSRAEECRRCAELGMTKSEAAEAMGLSLGGVTYWAKKLGLKFRRPKDRRRGEVQACAEQGMSMTETAQHVGLSLGGVTYWASKLGLEFVNKQGQQPKGKKNWACRDCVHREECQRIINTPLPMPCMAIKDMLLPEGHYESELESWR